MSGLISSSLSLLRAANNVSAFDDEFGTDTERIVPLWKLAIASSNGAEGIRYQTIDPTQIRSAIKSLPINPADFVFVDLGSGKGRSLLIASEFPFKQIIGVEFSQKLNNIAVANIAKHPRPACGNVISLHQDAALFDFPPENLVIYLYHPFGEAVFHGVLENLASSIKENDRPIYIIYFNPLFAHLLDATATLRRVDLLTAAAVYMHQAPASNSSN
jgi:SAM-dependent methyltransferase